MVTGVHLDAHVGRVAVCAEAIAIGRAVTEFGHAEVETIVSVFHPPAGEAYICAPCGMCRELIGDYAPNAHVLMPHEDREFRKVAVSALLPGKFNRRPSGDPLLSEGQQ